MDDAAMRYRAFISYSHRDKAVAAWVQGALERYHIPAKLVGRETALGPVPARLHPLFRDRDELPASGDLGAELMGALRQSMFLILICSPAAAQSRWVGEEVLNFKRMHGEGRVLALICDGEPGDPERECFPRALQYIIGPDGELTDRRAEPIAADIRSDADGRRLAKFKLIAGLTGLKLDDLIQRESARRMQRLVATSVASTIGMVLAIGLAIYANSQRLVAEEQRKVAETETTAARAAADYLVGTFELANPATDNPRTITALTILDRSADRARTELAAQPGLQARMIETVARAYNNLGLFAEARAALEKSRAAIDRAGTPGANALVTLATTQYRMGDLDGAVATARSAETRVSAGKDTDADKEVRARARELVAHVLAGKAEDAKALVAYDQALALYRSAQTPRPERIAQVLNNRGVLLSDMGRYADAENSLSEANRLYRTVYRGDHLVIGQNHYALALNDYLAGKLPQADANVGKALAIYAHVLDADNFINADALSLRGQILRDSKRPAAAEAALKRAVAIYRRSFGKPHYMIGIADVYLGLAASDQGQTERALAYLDDAKVNYDASYGKLHANHGDLLVNRAVVLAHAGRRIEAATDCKAGLAILDQTLGRSDPFYATSAKTCAGL